ncbi:hypothetical protein P170DRAFT_432355 [Aspergillus steynii IBT 23096]|uniref:Uncharacterized protein n=1 Tax=Aspergillus steynii IBT 23096 TaxID=1392250 RepID=A0A2I2GPF9_9EURO|nr:uncharacterized protein P170DRAFT_432355 [Aspergillus steynii IBT 23096]PLB54760.1 hypothetical protein P170DRAFT_432355 [Aspergillus steynii IBT 23096]
MTLLKPLLLASILSISASATEYNCPTGWLPNQFKQERCCPGGMVVDEQGAYCCVQDMRFYKEALTNSALLYETATTTSDSNMDWTTEKDINSCYATVRFTASDYSARVSSALSKAEATPTDGSSSEATATASSSTRSGARSTAGSQTATATATATETSNAAVLIGPAEGLLGGVVFAVGAFML